MSYSLGFVFKRTKRCDVGKKFSADGKMTLHYRQSVRTYTMPTEKIILYSDIYIIINTQIA